MRCVICAYRWYENEHSVEGLELDFVEYRLQFQANGTLHYKVKQTTSPILMFVERSACIVNCNVSAVDLYLTASFSGISQTISPQRGQHGFSTVRENASVAPVYAGENVWSF